MNLEDAIKMRTMKKFIPIALLFALGVFTLNSCKKERLELEPPSSKLEGINATWKLIEVIQVDEADALFPEMEVSEAFIGEDGLEITFNSNDFSYSVRAGESPNYFGTSGTWAFDDNEFPTLISISHDGKTENLNLLRTVRTVDKTLEFRYYRQCADAGKNVVSYKMVFERK